MIRCELGIGERRPFFVRSRRLAARAGAAIVLILSAAGASAAATFHFEDPMETNAVTFTLDSRLNAIVGTATGISGTVRFDPAHPELTNGDLYVESASIRLTNPEWTADLTSPDWLDVENYPKMSFALKAVREVEAIDESTWSMKVMGGIVCRGKVARLDAPLQVTFVPNGMAERTDGAIPGDLLIVRTTFVIKRSELALDRVAVPAGKLSDDIQIHASLVGYTKPEEKQE